MICLVLFLFILPSTLQKPPIDAKDHLHRYGFLNSSSPDPEALKAATTKFQKINKLNVTGEVNEETKIRMSARRCGRPDGVPDYDRPVAKWSKTHLSYTIQNWTRPLTKLAIKTIFDRAVRVWTHDVNLNIEERDSEDADILFHFTQQDGPNGILGYAYFPESGDIYLDADEEWNPDVFAWVVAHELGHSLGLPHSEDLESIMFPYYLAIEEPLPSPSDVEELRFKYGAAKFNNTILCSGATIDAILDLQEPKFIIGDQYWNFANGVVQSGPFSLDLLFPDLTGKIDAAFAVGATQYFLANDTYDKFVRDQFSSRKVISKAFEGVPSDIDAAFFDRNSTIYFFKGSKYYGFKTRRKIGERVVVNGENIMKGWKGVPSDVEAVTIVDDKVLFIKKFKCYLVDLGTRELISKKDCSDYYQCE